MKTNNKAIIKKIAAIFLILIISVSASFSSSAVYFGDDDKPGITDNEALVSHIKNNLLDLMMNWDGTSVPIIDIKSFKILSTDDNKDALKNILINCSPETYMNIAYTSNGAGGRNYSCTYVISTIDGVKYCTQLKLPKLFINTAAEFKSRLKKCQDAANEMLKDIKGSSLTEAEKVLLVHDRLALLLKYDDSHTAADNYNIYGALINNLCICDGYANAFRYLLAQLGIDSTYCKSDDLNHTWNIVKVNGKKYHVDVTWDDPTSPDDIPGCAQHTYLLKSTDYMKADADHKAPDFSDTAPTDKTYDNWFMNSSRASAQLLDGTIYFIDNVTNQLKKISGNSAVKVRDLGSSWSVSTKVGGKDSKSLSSLAADGKYLYYAKTDGIYKFDPTSNKEEKIRSFSDVILGFTYNGSEFEVLKYNKGSEKFSYKPSDTLSSEFTLKFVVDGSTVMEKKLSEGDAVTKPSNPSKSGYTFKGWNPEVPAKMPAKDMTFTAVFEKNPVKPGETDISKVTINAPSGNHTINWKYRAQLTASADLPDGYKIIWYENGKPVSDSNDFITGALTDAHTYTAKIVDSTGKTVSTQEQEKTVTIEVKSDFFTKIISFFMRLFGSDIERI